MDWTPNGWGDVLAIIGVSAAVLSVIDWRIRGHIDTRLLDFRELVRSDIEKATRPISPGYRNGGESLADLAHEIRRLRDHLGIGEP